MASNSSTDSSLPSASASASDPLLHIGLLSQPVGSLSGVGPVRAKAFASLGVHTLGDLLEYFPRDYQLESSEATISDLQGSDTIQSARGEIVAVNYVAGTVARVLKPPSKMPPANWRFSGSTAAFCAANCTRVR